MTNQTHSSARLPEDDSADGDNNAQIVTQVCYLPYDAGPQNESDPHAILRAGLRAIEPPPTAKHAIRGNLYIIVELGEHTNHQSPSYTPAELRRISERLLGLVQTAYYTAKGSQTAVIERAIHQVHQELNQINHERPQTTLRAGITCACLLKNRLLISCSGPALALIASDDALEQFPWHQSDPGLTLGGSQQPEIHTYKRRIGGSVSLFMGSNRWLEHFTVRKLLGTVAQATLDDCDEIAQYISDESGENSLPGLLVAAELPALQNTSPPTDSGPSAPNAPNPSSGTPSGSSPAPQGLGSTHSPESSGRSPQNRVNQGSSEGASSKVPPPQAYADSPSASTNPSAPNPLTRKRSMSLPTSVHASPPVTRAPESEPTTPTFEQTQEMSSVVELRPGPAPSIQKKSQSAQQPTQSAAGQTLPFESSTPRSEERSQTSLHDPDLYRYSRQGAAAREAVDHSAFEPQGHIPPPSQGRENGESWRDALAGHSAQSKQEVGSSSSPINTSALIEGIREQVSKAGAFFSTLLPGREVRDNQPSIGQPSHGPSHSRSGVAAPTVDQMAGSPSVESMTVNTLETAEPPKSTRGRTGYSPPPPASGSRARIFVSLAILLAFLIFVVVYVAIWRQGIASAERAEDLITAAEGHINDARASLTNGNSGNARVSLQTAQGYLMEAEQLGGPTNRVDQLLVDIRQELQTILQVTPLYGLVSPLVTFPFESSPHRVLVVDQDIYILDNGQNQIIRYRLDESRTTVPDQAGSVVLKQGQNVEGVTVGPLIDISWQSPIPGVMDKANLMVLDGNNNVFRYNQRVDGAALQTFGEQDQWQTPTQIQTYIGRFYITDGGRGQIYRYSPGAYDQPPEPWLIASNPSAISSLASMMIDGDIWLLFNNGQLLKYHQGEQQPFDLENDVGKIQEPVDLYIGNQDNSFIYLADAGEERILVFAKDGTYIQQLQAAEGNPLQELRGIFIDETARTIYLLTERGLFQHPLVE